MSTQFIKKIAQKDAQELKVKSIFSRSLPTNFVRSTFYKFLVLCTFH